MNDNLVSVIIPTFNYGRFIGQTLESLIAQTYAVWECIVVDDGSADDTKEVVERFCAADSRIRYVYQRNRGVSAARNTGMKEAKGQFVQFLDADDLLEKRKFELQVRYLVENPEVDMVYGDARYFPSGDPGQLFAGIDGGRESKIKRVSGGGRALLAALLVDNIIVICCPLLRRKVVERFGYFDETLATLEDWDYWLRCVDRPLRIAWYDDAEARALVRYHSESASRSRRKMLESNISIRKKLAPSLEDRELRLSNRTGLANATMALAAELARQGKLRDAFALLVSSHPLAIAAAFSSNVFKRARKSCTR